MKGLVFLALLSADVSHADWYLTAGADRTSYNLYGQKAHNDAKRKVWTQEHNDTGFHVGIVRKGFLTTELTYHHFGEFTAQSSSVSMVKYSAVKVCYDSGKAQALALTVGPEFKIWGADVALRAGVAYAELKHQITHIGDPHVIRFEDAGTGAVYGLSVSYGNLSLAYQRFDIAMGQRIHGSFTDVSTLSLSYALRW